MTKNNYLFDPRHVLLQLIMVVLYYLKRSCMKVFLFLLEAFAALSLLLFGLVFINYPDGSALNLNTRILVDAPFRNFTVPGILLTANGVVYVLSLLQAMGEPRRNRYNWTLAGGLLTIVFSLVAIMFVRPFLVAEWVALVLGVMIVLMASYLKGKWIL